MSLVAWGARKGDVQIGSPEDRFSNDLRSAFRFVTAEERQRYAKLYEPIRPWPVEAQQPKRSRVRLPRLADHRRNRMS